MEEIQVGEYVRTPEGIRRILGEIETKYIYGKKVAIFYEYEIDKLFRKSLRLTEEELEIFPHSLNPIDIIRVGDYVNGLYVHNILDYGLKVYMNGDIPEIIKSDDIKSIVTKEQFETMKYKLEE